MLAAMVTWGAVYGLTLLVLPFASTPNRPLPAYALYLALGMAPWTIWLLVQAGRKSAATRIATVVQACVVLVITFPVHLVATRSRWWDYFEDKDRLLGPRVGGVPVEEFFFYPLTIGFALLLYLWMCDELRRQKAASLCPGPTARRFAFRLPAIGAAGLAGWLLVRRTPALVEPVERCWDLNAVPHFAEGPAAHGWTAVCLASFAANLTLFEFAWRRTKLSLRAVILLTGPYLLVCLLVELLGISRGWWVYNERQCSGWAVGGVPVENLAAYLTGIFLPLSVFEVTRTWLGDRGLP